MKTKITKKEILKTSNLWPTQGNTQTFGMEINMRGSEKPKNVRVWAPKICCVLGALLLARLTNSTEQSPSWEATMSSASQEIPSILWNPKVHHRIHKSAPPVPILSKIEHPSHCNRIHSIRSSNCKHACEFDCRYERVVNLYEMYAVASGVKINGCFSKLQCM